MAAPPPIDGHEKVLAAAHQIVKSLATSQTAADDMLRILSSFDNRLSSITPRDVTSDAIPRLDSAENLVHHFHNSDALVFDPQSPEFAHEYLSAVDDLIALSETPENESSGSFRTRAENALQLAMARLEDEFQHLMIRSALPLDLNGLYFSIRRLSLSFASDATGDVEFDIPESPLSYDYASPKANVGSPEDRRGSGLMDEQNVELVNSEAVGSLQAISTRMVLAKYECELRQVYCDVRREILNESLAVLGVDRMSIEEVQRLEWQLLDEKMKKWIQAVKVFVRVILFREKGLCNRILAASEELSEECFVETAKACVLQLLNFGDAVVICQRSSEKLFRILDMYEAMADVLPDLIVLFSKDHKDLVCEEAEGVLKRLGEAVKGTLGEFENAVRTENSRKPMQFGEIHPATRYVMNYMRLLVVYSETLDSLLDDAEFHESNRNDGDENSGDENLGSTTPLGRHLRLVISYLESNLEGKSKGYEDGALQYIFLMNNILYIVNKVKDSELGKLLGDNWIRKRRGQIRQYATSYLRTSWTKVLSCLRDDGLGSGGSSSASKVALKEKFKNFNLAFEEVYRVQTTWKVPDPQLREELRISISEKVLPAYRAFMGRYGSQLEGRHAAKYMKYSPEDLEGFLSDFFEGLPGVANYPKKKNY